MAITDFPASAVCYILDDIPGVGEFQGSGVIIGPHTILTAAHLLYDADTGQGADAVSVYPGFVPSAGTYNPPGALGGVQSIHYVKVPDFGDDLSAEGTQSDFAVINTSVDLSGFGRYALDPTFTSGSVITTGYPASGGGYQGGHGGTVYQAGSLSDLDTSDLPLSPGNSGGPIWDKVTRNGEDVPAVVGVVSTDGYASKLTRAKVALIRHWIAADQSLYAGGLDAPRGLTPQLAGTVSGTVDAAAVAPAGATRTLAAPVAFAYRDAAGQRPAEHRHLAAPAAFAYQDAAGQRPAEHRHFAAPSGLGDLVHALHARHGAGPELASLVAAASAPAATIAAPALRPGSPFGGADVPA